MKLNIALAQMELEFGEPERNLAAAKKAVVQAVREGSDIVLLPELWASGYDLKNASSYASSINEGWFSAMCDLAKEHSIVLGGSLIEQAGEDYYNTFLLVDQQGEQLGTYRKAHLFDLIDEKVYFTPGAQPGLVKSPWGKIGLALCYDLRFPELFRAYALKGAQLILLVAEWPRSRIAHWDVLLQARAIENQCFIAAVNKVGRNHGNQLGGNSVVVGPLGEILVQGGAAPAVFTAEIDLDEVAQVRNWMPVLDDRNPAVYD